MSDYPRIPEAVPLFEVAKERLEEAIEVLLERAGISEDELRVPRPFVAYDVQRHSAYQPWSNTIVISPRGFNRRDTYGEEAAHWLFYSVNPDDTLTGFDCREKNNPDWELFYNLHEVLGRYGANILTEGRAADETRDYSGFDDGHRAGYRTADAIWREQGSNLFRDLLLSNLDELLALIDPYGFSIGE